MRHLLLPTALVFCGLVAIGVWWLAPHLWPMLSMLAFGLLFLLVLAALNPSWQCFGPVTTRGSSARSQVALTFDDGPDPEHTKAVLEALDSVGAKATFFMVGEKVRRYPDLVREVHARGHQVGHHSAHHDWRVMLSPVRAARDLESGDAAFASALELRPRFFRPPIGLVTPELLRAVEEADMVTLLWSLRTLDGGPISAKVLVRRVLDRVKPGDIVLLHDARESALSEAPPAAVEALPTILEGLQERGLDPVTVSTLLDEPAYFPEEARPAAVNIPRRGFLPRAVAVTFALLVFAAGASALAESVEPKGTETVSEHDGVPASFVAVAKVLAGHTSVKAQFVQRKASPLFVDEVIQRGVLRLRNQDRRLLWSYEGGATLLLAEGQFYSQTEPDSPRTARRLPPIAARMAKMMDSLFFLKVERIQKHFRVADEGPGLFVLRPLREGPTSPFQEVRLQVGGEPLTLLQVVLLERGGDVTRIDFSEVELGKELPKNLFLRPGEEPKEP